MSTKKIHVVSVNPLVAQNFIQTACGLPVPSERGYCALPQQDVELASVTPDEVEQADLASDGVVLLVEHLDVISTERLRRTMKAIAERVRVPLRVSIFRRSEQQDYKISCLQCGQKLLINDESVGRRGTCPRCQNVAVLPSQRDFAQAVLGIEEGSELLCVVKGRQDSALEVLSHLLSGEGAVAPPQAPIPPAGEGRPKLVIKRKS